MNRGARKFGAGARRLTFFFRHRLLAGLFLAGILLVTMAAVSCSPRDAEQSLTRAVQAWDSGDYKLAAEEYERFLGQYPNGDKTSEARFQLANIYYFKLRLFDQARSHYAAFLEQFPTHSNAHLARERLAEVLEEMGRSYEAIAEYENLNPQNEDQRRRIRLRIADLYFAQRNYSQALTEYEKVIERVPYDELSEQAYLREASIYHIERSQYQQALPVYQKLASMTGDNKVKIRAMYGLVDCYAGLYRFEEAMTTLRDIPGDAEQADVARRLAELEQQKREATQARSGLNQETKRIERSAPAPVEPGTAASAEADPEDANRKQKPAKRRRTESSDPSQAEKAKPENTNRSKPEKP